MSKKLDHCVCICPISKEPTIYTQQPKQVDHPDIYDRSHPAHTYHVDDLLECDPEGEDQGVALVPYRPLQGVVVEEELLQQPLLVGAADAVCWKKGEKIK